MESAAFSYIAFEPHFSVHQVHQLGADRQAESGAAVPAGHGLVSLTKWLQNNGLLFFRDADSRIPHGEMQHDVLRRLRVVEDSRLADAQSNLAGIGKFDGVTQQVYQNL